MDKSIELISNALICIAAIAASVYTLVHGYPWAAFGFGAIVVAVVK